MDEKKFILDTNIWISYIVTDTLGELIESIVLKELTIYADRHLMNEIKNVLLRPKYKKYLKAPVSQFIEVIELGVTMVNTQPRVSHLPDPKDNFLIALARASQTINVVTGDKALLALSVYEGVEFVSLADFRKLLKSESNG
ncbi:MAG TPA: putative toxin-antitoxin system toxin component, PIN family [Chitinophagales bacterium]|nr:putative toxin-antitoxin system toxin component, PIN family [Chitinophagales bacterium]